MRHFRHLPDDVVGRLFCQPPAEFSRHDDRQALAVALGATLYVPANRPDLAAVVRARAAAGSASLVLDLEDGIGADEVGPAQEQVVAALRDLAGDDDLPLLFVRVRRPGQLEEVVAAAGPALGALTGFVLPKVDAALAEDYLDRMAAASARTGVRLLAMPVLESPAVIHRETRTAALTGLRDVLAAHRGRVLAVRIGAADLCSAYGIRRDRDLTVYDVHLVAEVIADVVNLLGRADGTGFTVTGPVWEYFPSHERILKPQLRSSPFEEHDAVRLREALVTRDLDGLIREVMLDRANGLTGKTVIHPSHVPAVHALSVVTHEEHSDALTVVQAAGAGGVRRSAYGNKMNEVGPHHPWAVRTLRRADAFGVAAEGVTFVDLLVANAQASGAAAPAAGTARPGAAQPAGVALPRAGGEAVR